VPILPPELVDDPPDELEPFPPEAVPVLSPPVAAEPVGEPALEPADEELVTPIFAPVKQPATISSPSDDQRPIPNPLARITHVNDASSGKPLKKVPSQPRK